MTEFYATDINHPLVGSNDVLKMFILIIIQLRSFSSLWARKVNSVSLFCRQIRHGVRCPIWRWMAKFWDKHTPSFAISLVNTVKGWGKLSVGNSFSLGKTDLCKIKPRQFFSHKSTSFLSSPRHEPSVDIVKLTNIIIIEMNDEETGPDSIDTSLSDTFTVSSDDILDVQSTEVVRMTRKIHRQNALSPPKYFELLLAIFHSKRCWMFFSSFCYFSACFQLNKGRIL